MKSDKRVLYAPLGEYADVIDPHPSHRAPEEVENGYPFLGIGDIDYFGKANFDRVRHVDISVIEEHEKSYTIDDRTIGYAKMGNTIGKIVSFPDRSVQRYAVSPALSIINPKTNINPWCLRAIIESYEFWGYVNGKITGSTRPSIGIQQLRNIPIPIFPAEVQTMIGEIWKVIYDKIALNTAINENLEQQISEYFKKMFPDILNSNGQDTLEQLILFSNGKKRPNEEGSIPVFGGNGILAYTNKSNSSNCVIIGRVGAYCGNVSISLGDCWISDNAISAKSKITESQLFIYYILKNASLPSRHIGSGQPLMTQGILKAIPCNLPQLRDIEDFERKMIPLQNLITENSKENQRLADLRDTLLPKLMNGEIDVSEVKV